MIPLLYICMFLGHVSVDMVIIFYTYCMCLTIYWFLLSCVFVYICLCLYISILHDCVLHDYHFFAWLLSVLDCYDQLWYWHIDDIDWFTCHDYPARFDMYIYIIVYLICLDTLIFSIAHYFDHFSSCYLFLLYTYIAWHVSCLACM